MSWQKTSVSYLNNRWSKRNFSTGLIEIKVKAGVGD